MRRGRCSRWPASTRSSACSSASRSAASRRSATGWPRRSSPSRPPRRCSPPPGWTSPPARRPWRRRWPVAAPAPRRSHCQQVLAGIGFTTEHPLHRYVRRVLVLDELLRLGPRPHPRPRHRRDREQGAPRHAPPLTDPAVLRSESGCSSSQLRTQNRLLWSLARKRSMLARSSGEVNERSSAVRAKSSVASTARSRCMLRMRLVSSTARCGQLGDLLGAGQRLVEHLVVGARRG